MMDDLSKLSTKQLQAELKKREVEEYRRKEQLKRERAEKLFAKVDILLQIASEHSRSSCNDKSLSNVDRGCLRCFLLDAKFCGWWDPEYELVIHISTPYRH